MLEYKSFNPLSILFLTQSSLNLYNLTGLRNIILRNRHEQEKYNKRERRHTTAMYSLRYKRNRRNSNFVQYDNEIVMIDAGYSFPGQEMYGIDYAIPNTKYLKRNKEKVKLF